MNDGARPLPRSEATRIARAFLPRSMLGNRWHYYYAREKLARDPLYAQALAALHGCDAPLLDIGCGLGLLAHVLRANGRTPAYLGVDVDAGKIVRARQAAGRARLTAVVFESCGPGVALPAHRGSVAILDVLQYLPADLQQSLLASAARMLVPGARLVLRAALDDGGARSRATRFTDWIGHLSGWMQTRPESYPRADALRETLEAAGLRATFTPLHGAMPLNHWLVVAERATGLG